jgi:hypothetical protein
MNSASAITDILTYDQTCTTKADCGVNYFAIAWSTCELIRVCWESRDTRVRRHKLLRAFVAYLFFWMFQVVLCAAVTACVGVSIVWNANLGYIFFDRWLGSPAIVGQPRGRRFFSLFDANALFTSFAILMIAIDVWYACTDEYITTVAHILAILLGIVVFLCVNRVSWCDARGRGDELAPY